LLRGFVARVEDSYQSANLVLIPTPVSAGTNIKALEAMAAGRAIVSTPSGIHGIGLRDGESVSVAEGVTQFVSACDRLLQSSELRRSQATAARSMAEQQFGWSSIAQQQLQLWKRLAK
jgi:glycosyltransferase involved in cell wall biosynthesis